MILTNSWWFLNKCVIDSLWFSNKSKPWFSLILANSRWSSVILANSQISVKLILNDSHWFLNQCEIDSQWFSLIVMILNDSYQFSIILANSWWFSLTRWFLPILELVWNWFSLILADCQWFSNKSGFSLILTDSWFSLILDDSWLSLELILVDLK